MGEKKQKKKKILYECEGTQKFCFENGCKK